MVILKGDSFLIDLKCALWLGITLTVCMPDSSSGFTSIKWTNSFEAVEILICSSVGLCDVMQKFLEVFREFQSTFRHRLANLTPPV